MKLSQKAENNLFYGLFISLVVIFLFLTLGSILTRQFSVTYDEKSHYKYGEIIYHFKTGRFDDSKMPVSALNVIPVKIAENVFHHEFADQNQRIQFGRLSTALVALSLGYLCFDWARSLYGRWVALAVFGLFVFEPNLLAHSQLVTTDIYGATSMTLTLYLAWRFFSKPGLVNGALLGLALGLCQISKYSCILMYPMILLFALLRYWDWLRTQFKEKKWKSLWGGLWQLIKYALIIVAVSLLVINFGFFFSGFGTPLSEYPFKSHFFIALKNPAYHLNNIPLPLPYAYLEGLDSVMFRERTGGGHGPIYMLGQLSGDGFPGYYLVASLFKVPIPILLLLCLSVWYWLRSFRLSEFIQQDMYLLIPALIYSIYFNFFYQAQIGIRYLLIVFPILLIFSARLFRQSASFSRRTWLLVVAAGCYLIISVASYYPNYISYFNELVFNRTNAYHYLADSNLDWGQNRDSLEIFLDEHPTYHFEPGEPVAGTVVVGANALVGVKGAADDFQWLRDNFEPVSTFKRTYLIYDISPADLAAIQE